MSHRSRIQRLLLPAVAVVGSIVAFTLVALAQPSPAPKRPAKLPPLKPGLVATYAAGDFSVTLPVPRPQFTLAADESLHPQIPPQFTAVYEGVLRTVPAGKYTLSTAGEGFTAKIFLDNQPATNAELPLTHGDHPLRLEITRTAAASPIRFQLLWQSEHFPLEPVPARVLGLPELPPQLASHAKLERGRLLVEELNCIACHKTDSPSLTGRSGPDLTTLGSRVAPAWIAKWLENPRHFRPQAVMPRLLSKEDNRRNVTAFLASLKESPDQAKQFPDDAPATPQQIAEGETLFNTIGCADCHAEDGTGVSLAGVGSKYSSQTQLTRYLLDPLHVDPSGRMPSLLLSREEASALAAHLMQSKKPEYEGDFPGGNPMVGQQLFRIIGCLNCHDVRTGENNQRLQPLMAMAVKPLRALDPTRGCLSDAPRVPMPIYTLTPEERDSIRGFLDAFKTHPDVAAAPSYEFSRTVAKFNCVTCHNVNDTTALAGKELIPPLANSGMKLRESWIDRVLLQRERIRPWADRRMPDFGPPVRPVTRQIVSTGGVPPLAQNDKPAPAPEAVKAGQVLAGTGATGYGCIGCHAYNGSEVTVPPESRGPEITGMADRIRPDWFHRWVREPQRIQPNTAMPSFFLDKPGSEANQQIDQLWAYISLGKQMPKPEGLAQTPPEGSPASAIANAREGEESQTQESQTQAPAEPR